MHTVQALQVQLDTTGAGRVTFTAPSGCRWTVTSVCVTVSTATLEPTTDVYVGGDQAAHRVAGTGRGSRDTAGGSQPLGPGDSLTVIWSGGDPGAIATARLQIEQTEAR